MSRLNPRDNLSRHRRTVVFLVALLVWSCGIGIAGARKITLPVTVSPGYSRVQLPELHPADLPAVIEIRIVPHPDWKITSFTSSPGGWGFTEIPPNGGRSYKTLREDASST